MQKLLQNRLIQIVLAAVLILTVFQTLAKSTLGRALLYAIVVAAVVCGVVIYLVKNHPAVAARLARLPLADKLIGMICRAFQVQWPPPGPDDQAKRDGPRLLIGDDEFNVEDAMRRIRGAVRGHDAVVGDAMNHLRHTYQRKAGAGTTVFARPMGVFLFVGGEGVGKVYLADVLCQSIYRDGGWLRLDLSHAGDRSALFGTPAPAGAPGGAGGTAGRLIECVRENPFHTIVLENIDAAPADLQERLARMLDRKSVKDPTSGADVSLGNCLFVLTTTRCAETLAMVRAKLMAAAAGGGGDGEAGGGGRRGAREERRRSALDRAAWHEAATRQLVGDGAIHGPLLDRINGIFHFAQPDGFTTCDVILLLMAKECRRHKMTLEGVSKDVLLREVNRVTWDRGFDPLPARVARLLAPSIDEAVHAGHNEVRVGRPQQRSQQSSRRYREEHVRR